MATKVKDPYRNFRFSVEIAGIHVASFSDATIPDTSNDPIEYREGKDPMYARKLSGLVKFGAVTLKKGVTDSMVLYNWRKVVEEGGSDAPNAKKNVTLILMDTQGQNKATWNMYDCWPTKYSNSEFSGKGNDVMIETLELAVGHMERKK